MTIQLLSPGKFWFIPTEVKLIGYFSTAFYSQKGASLEDKYRATTCKNDSINWSSMTSPSGTLLGWTLGRSGVKTPCLPRALFCRLPLTSERLAPCEFLASLTCNLSQLVPRLIHCSEREIQSEEVAAWPQGIQSLIIYWKILRLFLDFFFSFH